MMLSGIVLPAETGHELYAAMMISKGWTPGLKLAPSGVAKRGDAGWQHAGYNHPWVFSLDYDPRDPAVLYLATGSGCVRTRQDGLDWVQLTSWDMTELMSVSVDRFAPDQIYVGLVDGIGFSPDGGRTWTRRQAGLERPFTQWVVTDRQVRGRLLAGTESGIFRSTDEGRSWRRVGAEGSMVFHLVQSPREPRHWLAATQTQGVLFSRDNGDTWRTLDGVPKNWTLHNVAWDAHNARRMAVCGWGLGVMVSRDGGATWEARNYGLPSKEAWRVAIDPDEPGRIYVHVHEQALYQSDDFGKNWKPAGLEGAQVRDLVFVPRRKR